MNKENLEQGLTKLLKTFYTKKFDRNIKNKISNREKIK